MARLHFTLFPVTIRVRKCLLKVKAELDSVNHLEPCHFESAIKQHAPKESKIQTPKSRSANLKT